MQQKVTVVSKAFNPVFYFPVLPSAVSLEARAPGIGRMRAPKSDRRFSDPFLFGTGTCALASRKRQTVHDWAHHAVQGEAGTPEQ